MGTFINVETSQSYTVTNKFLYSNYKDKVIPKRKSRLKNPSGKFLKLTLATLCVRLHDSVYTVSWRHGLHVPHRNTNTHTRTNIVIPLLFVRFSSSPRTHLKRSAPRSVRRCECCPWWCLWFAWLGRFDRCVCVRFYVTHVIQTRERCGIVKVSQARWIPRIAKRPTGSWAKARSQIRCETRTHCGAELFFSRTLLVGGTQTHTHSENDVTAGGMRWACAYVCERVCTYYAALPNYWIGLEKELNSQFGITCHHS